MLRNIHFHPEGGHIVVDISPQRNIFDEPLNADAVFINQRSLNPLIFLEVDFKDRSFLFFEREGLTERNSAMASFTVNLLGLNIRADLVEQRKAAFKFYKGELQRYVNVSATEDMPGLQNVIDPLFDTVDLDGDFEGQKTHVLISIENRIRKHSHPTIWKEMQRQHGTLNEVRLLFEAVPVALDW